MLELYSVRDNLNFGDSNAKFVPISEDAEEASYICCLASREEFIGNSRFVLKDYWVYPSIQAVFWKDALTPMEPEVSKINFQNTKKLRAWPASSPNSRQIIADSLGLKIIEEGIDFKLSQRFKDDLDFARHISFVYVQAQLRGHYITQDSLRSLVAENPEKILSQNLNLQIALKNKRDLHDLLAGFDQGQHSSEFKNDFRKILLNRLSEVQKFTPIQPSSESYLDYGILFKSNESTEAIVVKVVGNFNSIKNMGTRDRIKLLVEIG